MKYVILNDKFYTEYSPDKYPEILKKTNRPYVMIQITINNINFGLPLRSNISHPNAFWTNKEKGCGIDYTKAVLIADDTYIKKTNARIRPDEHKILKGKEYEIKEGFIKYINNYKRAIKKIHIPRNKSLCEKSTLKYYHEVLGIKIGRKQEQYNINDNIKHKIDELLESAASKYIAERDNNMDKKNDELMKKLEQGIKDVLESEKYKSFLKFQSQFHSYSINNQMLIFLQRPDATYVAGFKTWQKMDRQVLKGEKGISILAPNVYKYHKEVEKIDPETKEIKKEKVLVEGITFRKVSVFDIKQTSGKELPSICNELKGDSLNSENIINVIKKIAEIPIIEKPINTGAKGYFSPTEQIIAIKEGMSLDQTVKTMIHEYAHSQLHGNKDNSFDRSTKEVQAESIAYIVANHFGIDTSEYSFEYIANWSSGKELSQLKSSFDIIQKTSNNIIQKIEDALFEELKLKQSKEQVVSQYTNEFPAIKNISEKTAAIISKLNEENGQKLTISQINAKYLKAGALLEEGKCSIGDLESFKELKTVVDDLKRSEHKDIQENAKNNAQKINKEQAIEMA